MDPASVASLGLGVASLAIQVFDGAVKGYEYFAVASNMPERYESLRLRLQIEYGRLLDWGEAAGIVERPEIFDRKMKMNGGTVMALLSEMRSLLKKMRVHALRYDHMAAALPIEAPGEHRLRPIDTVNMKEYRAIFESKDIPMDRRKYPKGLNRLVELASGGKEMIKHPKRLRWAVIDEKVFHDDLSRMKGLTNFLHETLGDYQMKILMQTTRETYLALLQLTNEVRKMKIVAEVAPVPEIGPNDAGDTGSIFSQAETLADRDHSLERSEGIVVNGVQTVAGATIFEQLAVFRAVNASLYGRDTKFSLPVPTIDQANDLKNVMQLEGSQRMTAVYEGKNVWIEWKSYQRDEEIETPNDIEYRLSEGVRQDAERLVGLLRAKEKPVEFCVPYCAGYFDDKANDRFGFVYQVRDTTLNISPPRSLLELLEGDPASLKARIGLAQRLATCLLYFHATNWLHKALRSASIVFLNKNEGPEISHPYISSFEYSRPDRNDATFTGAPEQTEWAIYCHPQYLGRPGNFRKSFDIYSLGIILIEIAYWQPAHVIFDVESANPKLAVLTKVSEEAVDEAESSSQNEENIKADGESRSNAAPEETAWDKIRKVAEIQDWLLLDEDSGGRPQYLDHVRNVMGDKYHNAVKACISGLKYFHLPEEVDQTDPIIAALLQQAYLRLVVDVLNAIDV